MKKSNQKKILYVITKSNWGGAQRYVFDLAKAGRNAGMHVVVACGGNGLLTERLREENIETAQITSFQRDISFIKDIRSFFEVFTIVRKTKPDVIHINSTKAGGIGAFIVRLFFRACIIFTIHGLPQYEDRPRLILMFIGFATWVTCLLSHKVIVLSRHDMEILLKQPLIKKKLILIPHGIHETFTSKEESREMILHTLGSTISRSEREKLRDLMWVGTIAELHKNKGHVYALQAFADVAKNFSNVIYIVIGSGEEKDSLLSAARRLGIRDRIFFTGFIADAQRLYQAFDIVLLTSIKEGLPYTLIEAIHAGVPIIATNVGGVPDIISDKKTGLVVSPKNSDAIYESLEKLITDDDLRKTLGENAQIFSIEHFSINKMVGRTHGLYRDCVGKR